MYELFLALFLAFACPAQTHNQHDQNGNIVVTADSGGEQGHYPPPPPPPGGGN